MKKCLRIFHGHGVPPLSLGITFPKKTCTLRLWIVSAQIIGSRFQRIQGRTRKSNKEPPYMAELYNINIIMVRTHRLTCPTPKEILKSCRPGHDFKSSWINLNTVSFKSPTMPQKSSKYVLLCHKTDRGVPRCSPHFPKKIIARVPWGPGGIAILCFEVRSNIATLIWAFSVAYLRLHGYMSWKIWWTLSMKGSRACQGHWKAPKVMKNWQRLEIENPNWTEPINQELFCGSSPSSYADKFGR